MTEFTYKEQLVLEMLIEGLYAEPGFSDVEVNEFSGLKIDGKVLGPQGAGGVVSSLIEKGVVFVDDGHCIEGLGGLVYLNEEFYYLHPEWKKEIA